MPTRWNINFSFFFFRKINFYKATIFSKFSKLKVLVSKVQFHLRSPATIYCILKFCSLNTNGWKWLTVCSSYSKAFAWDKPHVDRKKLVSVPLAHQLNKRSHVKNLSLSQAQSWTLICLKREALENAGKAELLYLKSYGAKAPNDLGWAEDGSCFLNRWTSIC
jgi:hypothetical protein